MEEHPNGIPKRIAGKTKVAVFLIFIITVLLVLLIAFIWHRIEYASTDAVFVATDSLTSVGFNRVSGRLIKLYKEEGARVHKGEVLAVLDDSIYLQQRDRLAAQLAGARREMETRSIFLTRLKKQVALNLSIAKGHVNELQKQTEALVAKAASIEAQIQQVRRDHKRFAALYKADVISRQQLEKISTDLSAKLKEKKAVDEQAAALEDSRGIALDQVKLARANTIRIKETQGEIKALSDKVKGLAAALNEAKENVAECQLKSPINGRIAKRFFAQGSIVPPDRQVFSLVNPKDLFIRALLEENKLKGVVPGAPVDISIDAYPDQTYKGKVQLIMPASAATFALAPRDISAGEFTKVAQRIPVRIAITKGNLALLRVGLGGSVEIKRQ